MSGGDWKDMLSAVMNGKIEVVKYHLEHGIDPNYQHPELLTTPLIGSIEHGQTAITQLLLDHGASPQLKAGFSSDTPMKVARRHNNRAAIRLLRQYLPRKWYHFFG